MTCSPSTRRPVTRSRAAPKAEPHDFADRCAGGRPRVSGRPPVAWPLTTDDPRLTTSMKKLLLQLDSSRLPSVFDQVVAYDAGADAIMSYGNVVETDVRDLIHGCIFTRGPKDLKNTAVWIGGNNMTAGEQLLAMAVDAMFKPLTVSVMLDSNGSNTTAVAAVAKIEQALGDLRGKKRGDPRRHRPGGPALRRTARPGRRQGRHHVAQAGAGRQGAPVHQRPLQRRGRGHHADRSLGTLAAAASRVPTSCSTRGRQGCRWCRSRPGTSTTRSRSPST